MRRKRSSLFNGFWFDQDGHKLRRIRRDEYAELYRLRSKHADIRTSPKRWGALPMGEERQS